MKHNGLAPLPELVEGFVYDDPYEKDGTYLRISVIMYAAKREGFWLVGTNARTYKLPFDDQDTSP